MSQTPQTDRELLRRELTSDRRHWNFACVGSAVHAVLLVGLGLPMGIGGAILVTLGGSYYYLLAGVMITVAAMLRPRLKRQAAMVYGLALALTVGWALWESGLDGWALLPRLGLPIALGLGFLTWPSPRRWTPVVRRSAVAVSLLAVLGIASGQFWSVASVAGAPGALPPALSMKADWRAYGSDRGGSRFSSAALLTSANIHRLRAAWTYRIGEVNTVGKAGLQVTPLMVGDTLFLCSSFNDIIALDAETGRQRWRFHAKTDLNGVLSAGCRGVAYYAVPGGQGPCAERIITSTIDARLLAVDRRTGQPCRGFGRNGAVSLLDNMGARYPGYYYTTSAPTIARGRIIVGGWVTDNQYWGEPSGVIRAFDAVTGRFSWAMDVGHPNRHDQPSVGETYTLSTPNSWSTMSADDSLGLIYAPLGNPTPDYVGAQRRPFDEMYGSSIIAIDTETGALRWHFQTVHHDLWDYDVASQPVLADVNLQGQRRKILVQATKRGEIFVLDRVTGKPVVPVVERPVPQGGTAPGERVSPTQPFSAMPSLRGPDLTEASMWGISPLDQLWCRIKFKEARYQGVFTPPGLSPSVTYPGYLGGTNWGSLAIDPRKGRVIVNVSHVPNYTRIVPRAEAEAAGVKAMRPGVEGGFGYLAQEGTRYAAQTGPFLSPLGVPCNQPPFGRLVALDLATRKIAWQRALGTARDSGPFGVPSMLPITMGTPNTGGPVVTAGGLTLIGATQDSALRAFDSNTGEMLWTARLPAGGQATPMTYISPKTRRQFVVIAAGGNKWLGSKLGDYIVAFTTK